MPIKAKTEKPKTPFVSAQRDSGTGGEGVKQKPTPKPKKKPIKKPSKKPTQKTERKKVGRPSVIDDAKLKKLREAFLMGCTDVEACLYADIEPRTLYNYQNENPEFIQQKDHWKQNPILKARKVVFEKISEGDENTAKWLLERKARQEFSTKTEVGLTDKEGNDRKIERVTFNLVTHKTKDNGTEN